MAVKIYTFIAAMIWFLSAYGSPLHAEPSLEETNQAAFFSEEKWSSEAEKYDYNEETKKRKARSGGGSRFKFENLSAVVRIILFTLFFGLIIFFLVKYLHNLQKRMAPDDKTEISVENLQEAEENLIRANIRQLLDKLIAEQKYREAIRAYFLLALQQMHKEGHINWQKHKTNFDYVSETSPKNWHSHFIELTNYFEWVWYGKQEVAVSQFMQMGAQFQQLLSHINDPKK